MSTAPSKTGHLSAEEKRALLARLMRDKAGAGRAPDPCVHRLFEAQATRAPDAVAVSWEGASLTYAELNARANRLAHHLRALGVGPETLVGLCVGRSPEMVVGLLGILKAGGAYVPMDPAYPEHRITTMLEDAQVAVLVTEARLRATLPAISARLVCLDSAAEGLDSQPEGNPTGGATAANLAYVIYTSGSTGRPKGVMVTHGALTNFLQSMRQLLGLAGSDVLLAVTTLSFDIAALEMYLPLIQGARIEVVGRDEAADGPRLIARLESAGATFLQATPATWRLLLEAGWQGRPGLAMLCGGEALPRDLADRLADKGAALWNLYGPTETTIWSSAAKVAPAEDGPVAIGRPIANTQLYVLDSRLRPVPVGVAGELYIGGKGLARGYLKRAGMTAERFLPDPLGQTPGGRIYRTGDLARWLADGRLECLGRVDHQVKIRGYRIELGEIEAALARNPAVREAVVIAREDTPGEKRLVAYVVGRDGPVVAADLRRGLAEILPEYMVPSAFVPMDALPLTPNGKVDRKALPEPDLVRAAAVAYVAARGPIEEALAGTWGEILERPRVGVHDNFFDLGGDSLMAPRILARSRDLFGVDVPLADLFDQPTVAGLARRVEEALRVGAGQQSPPIKPVPRDGDLPASFAQQRLWFLDQLEPGNATYNIPIAVRLVGDLDPDALERAFNEVVRRHEALRTTFTARDGRPLQVIAPELLIPLPMGDLREWPEADREPEALRRLHAEAARPFDLARGPLIRASLLKLGEREHVVLLTMHHIISDGWSIGVLIREVGTLYEAFSRGGPSPLPALPLQYADFAAWQRGWLKGEVLQAQLDYWEGQLSGVPPLELPTDRPRPPVLGSRGGEAGLDVPQALVDSLRGLARQEGATLFMALLAGFQTLLSRYSGQEDLAIGSPIAGRTRMETEDLVGFFVNTLVLRGDLSGDPSFRALLGRVRRGALGAFAHQDLPFEQLVNVLHPERDPGRTPLFQVMFAMQNAPLPALESPGLAMTPIEAHGGTAKFEMTLSAMEKDDGLRLAIEYNADLFDSATADRMLRHLRLLLEGAVAAPDRAVASLPMMTDQERDQLLHQGAEDDPAADSLEGLSDDELDALLMDLSANAGEGEGVGEGVGDV